MFARVCTSIGLEFIAHYHVQTRSAVLNEFAAGGMGASINLNTYINREQRRVAFAFSLMKSRCGLGIVTSRLYYIYYIYYIEKSSSYKPIVFNHFSAYN